MQCSQIVLQTFGLMGVCGCDTSYRIKTWYTHL